MLLKTYLTKKGYYCTAMKKLLLHFLLLGSYFLTSAQSQNLEGNYQSDGYFFHPTNSRTFLPQKTITKISNNTYQVYLGDLGANGYSFQFTIDATNHLVNWTPIGSTPALPSSNFMTTDNPGGFTYSGQQPPGIAPYIHTSYNNTYDSVTHTLWMHYGYTAGSTGESGFSRQLYEKLILISPPILTSFSPTSGTLGTEITISGHNLSTTYKVNIQHKTADSFFVVSDSVVKAIVGTGNTGKIFLSGSNGDDSIGTFTFIPPIVDTNQWQYVGSAGFSTGAAYSPNMAISKNNIPYVVYVDSATRLARVKKFINGSWVDVGSGASVGKIGFIDLVIDDNEVPYIGYNDSLYNRSLTVRKFDGSSWITVGTPGFAPNVQTTSIASSIAVDNNNNLYAAVVDTVSGGIYNLSVYKFNGTTWTNLGIIGTPSFDFSFTIDKINNIPYIGYTDATVNYQATVKKYDGVNWITVGTSGFTNASAGVYYCSLKIDKNGDPIFAFQDDDGFERISTYKFSGGNWNIVGSERFSRCHSYYTTSLAIDKNNVPIVAFPDDFENAGLTIMNYSNTGNWNTIGYRGFARTYGVAKHALAIDTMNVPYVVFTDIDNKYKISVKKFSSSLLPLNFISFNAITKPDGVVYLSWKTASEVNTSHFNIQRSLDGSNFQNSSILKAVSISGNGKYELYDHLTNQVKGVIYYRLQIIDNDGHYKYSEVKSVKVQSISKYFIMPNPAKDFVVVSGNNIAAITIADVTGKTLMSNKNNRINISGLAKGIYFIRIEGNDGTIQTEKLLVE